MGTILKEIEENHLSTLFFEVGKIHRWELLQALCRTPYQKCDIIKGNKSDVRNINFELQTERGDKFLCFTLFLIEGQRIVHIFATRCPIEMGFGSSCSILNGQMIYTENQN